ncbi:hypothetical protein G6F40_015670 [Rhizopus arrhizus]|nr:hypothetical protein G6F40_015670 [Rhizopus arrhizus]
MAGRRACGRILPARRRLRSAPPRCLVRAARRRRDRRRSPWRSQRDPVPARPAAAAHRPATAGAANHSGRAWPAGWRHRVVGVHRHAHRNPTVQPTGQGWGRRRPRSWRRWPVRRPAPGASRPGACTTGRLRNGCSG